MEEIKKRPNPFEKKINEMSEVVEENKKPTTTTGKDTKTTSKQTSPKKPTKKATTKKSTTKTKATPKPKIDPKTGTYKQPTKKATTTKVEPKKATTSKKPTTTTKKPVTPKVTKPKPKKVESVIETTTPVIVTTEPENIPETIVDVIPEVSQPVETVNVEPSKPKPTTRTKLPKKDSKSLTIEPAPRQPEPPIVRPQPKKTKALTKEEKVLYKKLEETFNFVANLTWVIEERTMDTKNIPDLTLGELHVIEMVNQNNNKPMTLIAKKLKVTVGSLTIGVNRLVQKEYLLRTRDEMDHRVILLSVTPKGKKVLKFHDKFHEDILGLVIEGVSLPQAVKVLTQFANVLDYYYDPKSYEQAQSKEKKKK